MNSENIFIYSHVPKCGGKSIKASFIEHFGEENILFHWNDPFAHENNKFTYYSRRFYYHSIIKKKSKNKKLIFGHFSFNDIPKISNSLLITFIRDPIELFGSMYFYGQRKYKDTSPADYVGFAKYKNFGTLYKKFFGNFDISKIDFIGSVENYSESISKLNNKFNLDLKINKVNIGFEKMNYTEYFKEKKVYDQLIEINKENIEIYNNLKKYL